MFHLATITLNKQNAGDFLVFVTDIKRADQNANGGATLTYRDGTKEEITETVANVQTAINALWDEYITALGDPT